jgi:hypothetical protein
MGFFRRPSLATQSGDVFSSPLLYIICYAVMMVKSGQQNFVFFLFFGVILLNETISFNFYIST